MKYTVYFELFGKKMQTTVSANSVEEAKKVIHNKIVFHKVVEKEKNTKEAVDSIMKLFNKTFKEFDKLFNSFNSKK